MLLLDEPSEGVQQENIDLMKQLIIRSCSKGVTCILCEQNLSFVLDVADRIAAIDSSGLLFDRPVKELTKKTLSEFCLSKCRRKSARYDCPIF